MLEPLGGSAAKDARPLHVAWRVVPIDESTWKRGDPAFSLDLEDLSPDPFVVVERKARHQTVTSRAQQVLRFRGQETTGDLEREARLYRRRLEIGRIERLERLELNHGVEVFQHLRYREFVLLDGGEVESRQSSPMRLLAPEVEHVADLQDPVRTVDEEERLPVHFDRPVVAPGADEVVEVALPDRLVGLVRLLLEDVVIASVPATRPSLVRPCEADGEVEVVGLEH